MRQFTNRVTIVEATTAHGRLNLCVRSGPDYPHEVQIIAAFPQLGGGQAWAERLSAADALALARALTAHALRVAARRESA